MPPKVKLPVFRCRQCGHEWSPRKAEVPLRCGKCKSPYWQREKARKGRR